MDSLAVAAGTAIVSAMATDGWEAARAAIARLWRQVHPERAASVDGELAEVRSEVLSARAGGDRAAEQELAGDWARKIQRLLLAGDPGLRAQWQRLLDDTLAPLLPPAERTRVSQIAAASGDGQVYQAGRDQQVQNITASAPGAVAQGSMFGNVINHEVINHGGTNHGGINHEDDEP